MSWFRRPSSAPLWQEEFPVFTADERYVNRRQFSKFLTLTSLSMFVGNVWILARSLWHSEPAYAAVEVVRAGEVPVGGVKVFYYPQPDDPCILVRTAEDVYVAYSQKCTHLSCAVYYEREGNRLECPCHNGVFSIVDGAPVQGPPQRPLPRVVLERRGDALVAVRMEAKA